MAVANGHTRDPPLSDVFELLASKFSMKSYKSFHNYLTCVAEQLGESQPFYTFDLADILWKDQLWREKFPNVTPYYAVKANADPVLVRLYVLLGYGFDCSTEGEIRLVMNANADPEKIIFAHTIKTRQALKYASSVGVKLMTFDSQEELLKISKYFPGAKLVLRLKSKSTQNVYNLSRKFGCDLTEAEGLLLRAKELNLNVVGVSFHVGALCDNPKTYTDTIDDSRLVFNMAETLGYKLTIIDIGAGFFGSSEREGFFHELSVEINKSLEKNFPDKNVVEYIAEPGCYCVASAVSLTTAIIGKKKKYLAEGESNRVQREYYLNDGFYGSFFEHKELYDIKPLPILKTTGVKKRSIYKSRLWGQTCCSEDMIFEECSLPDMEEDELIHWINMGAYSRGVTSTFTIVPYPAERYIFIKNSRLNLKNVNNPTEVMDLISKSAVLIENMDVTD